MNEIDTAFGKEKLKVTCIERKYKISSQRFSYIIAARKELDEDITKRILHEDMELKTFLANYEIVNIMLPMTTKKEEITKEKMPERSERTTIKTTAQARRSLIDFLILPEEFTTTDYIKALEEKGIKCSNPIMQHDDLKWLEEKGKVAKIGKRKVGRHNMNIFKRLKKGEAKEIEIDRTLQSLKEGQKAILGTIR